MSALEPPVADESPNGTLESEATRIATDEPIERDRVVRLPEAQGTALAGLRRIGIAVMIGDGSSILVGLITPQLLGGLVPVANRDFGLVLALAPAVWIAVFHSFGLYGLRYLSAPEEFRRVISATTFGVLLVMVGSVWWDEALDRPSLAITWAVALVLEFVVRRVARWYIGQGRQTGRLALRTLIIGTNEEAVSVANVLAPSVRGFVPIGFVAPSRTSSEPENGVVLGTLDDLPGLISGMWVECVLIASTAVTAADMYRISRCCRMANIEMRVSANTREVLTSRVSVHQVHDLMVLAVRSAKLTRSQAMVKRSFDLIVSSIGLVLSAPLMTAIAVAVKVSSPGPILFRQERVTKDGRSFIVLKFRTMFDPARRSRNEAIDISQPFFKLAADPRMTRIGRILRSWSLDELPQLWNVIRGDMSLVGPRPLAVEQVASNIGLLEARHEVRAGLTGWWQVNGRSELDPKDALKMDVFYIENWSLALDLYVVLKTVGVVLTRKGAY